MPSVVTSPLNVEPISGLAISTNRPGPSHPWWGDLKVKKSNGHEEGSFDPVQYLSLLKCKTVVTSPTGGANLQVKFGVMSADSLIF